MPVSEATYRRLALEDPDGLWELHCGRLVGKPEMTVEHNQVARVLGHLLQIQLPLSEYVVAVNIARLRYAPNRYYIPDVCVLPMALVRGLGARPGAFEAYDEPVPLVVEVWSPSTGRYDIGDKLEGYRRRGDLEIWRIHPYDRDLVAWARMPDGSYVERRYEAGVIAPSHVPGVSIDLTRLFELAATS